MSGSRWRALAVPILALSAVNIALLAAPAASAAPDCPGGRIAPRTLASTGDTLEYGIFDRGGRFFYSDQSTSSLMRIDRFGDAPKRLAPIPAPGAMVFASDGSIIIGTGDGLQNGATGDMNPMSGLLRVDPDTGATQTYVTGLGMANGIALAPDGTLYATNDAGFDIDRVQHGKIDHPWARVYSTNGIVVSPDDRYVYVSQTFAPAAIQRISVTDPSQVTPYAVAQGGDIFAGLDDMTMDQRGNLYVAANGAGQVWKVNTRGEICVLTAGLFFPSAVNFGVGSNSRNLYVVAFDGHISELADVLPSPAAPGSSQGGPRCPYATGRLSGKTLGLVRLGMTRAQARRAYKHSSDRGKRYEDFFCLTPIGVRVAYASPKLLKTLAPPQRTHLRGRVVWASTSNRFYSLRGVHPGVRLAVAARRLRVGHGFHVGLNWWYYAPNRSSTALLKVRHGIVEEVGIADKTLTQGRRSQLVFIDSFF